MIEIFNAINALSENKSLLTTGLLLNPLLLIACALSFVFHLGILYIPFFAEIFGTCPLTKNDWILTLVLASPVFLIEEIVKAFVRFRTPARFKGKKDQ